LRPSPRLARELCSGPNGLLLAGGPTGDACARAADKARDQLWNRHRAIQAVRIDETACVGHRVIRFVQTLPDRRFVGEDAQVSNF
jgi:hypothetical protein